VKKATTGTRAAMSTASWGIVAAAAVCAGFAAPHARRSRLALAIAIVGACMVLAGLIFGALGYGGCSRRGDCGALGGTLRTVLAAGVLVLPVLLLAAATSWVWRRVRPARARSARPIGFRERAMAVIGGLFLIISVGMIAAGSGQDRIAGVVCALFSLAVLAVPLSALLPETARGAPRLDRVEHDGVRAPAVVLDGSRGKLRLMRVAVALLAATGVLMAVAPEPFADFPGEETKVRVGGIVCAAVFGAVLVIGFFTRGRFRLALVPDGLRWEVGASPVFVAWDDVVGVSLMHLSGAEFLGIDVDRPEALKTTSTQRRIARFSRPIAGADVSITLEPFPVEPERLVDAIAAYADDPALRHEIGTERSLARLTGGAVEQPERVGA
jgi:hypothetical protein